MASYESSEIATAAALMYSTEQLMIYSKDRSGLISLVEDAKKKLEKMSVQGGIVQFGSEVIKQGFIKEMDSRNEKFINDMVTGISAAIGIRNYIVKTQPNLTSKNPSIYMTGDSWPEEVKPFRVSAYGFSDYNSSDLMVTGDKKTFYGISLKKKNVPTAPDPTLINKAFDTALDEKGLKPDELRKVKEMKKKVVETRIEYFSDLVVQAVDSGIIRWEDITKENGQKIKNIQEWNSWKKTDAGKKELFESKKRDKSLFGDYSYIDTKGYANHAQGYLYNKTTDPKSMRFFVNKQLSDSNNKLWKAFLNVMNEYSDVFADILINIILKTKLYEELDIKQIQKQEYKFNFFLVSGIGTVTKKGEVTVSSAQILPLETTLCGLTRIEEMYKQSKYEIVLDEEKQSKSEAAKIYFKLKRGSVNILDMELRYKGSFNPQPQFQAIINDDYKKLLKSECGL